MPVWFVVIAAGAMAVALAILVTGSKLLDFF